MKTIHRIAALVLALILSLSIALPALADARNETQAFSSSVVLVSYKGADGSRKATGVAIGDLTNPADVIVLEEKAFGSCFETEDQQEGMGAFLEKRKHNPFTNK